MYRIFKESTHQFDATTRNESDRNMRCSSGTALTRAERRNHHRESGGNGELVSPKPLQIRKSMSFDSLSTFSTAAETPTSMAYYLNGSSSTVHYYEDFLTSPSQRRVIVDLPPNMMMRLSSGSRSKSDALIKNEEGGHYCQRVPRRGGIERKKCIQRGTILGFSNSMITDDTSAIDEDEKKKDMNKLHQQPSRRSKPTLTDLHIVPIRSLVRAQTEPITTSEITTTTSDEISDIILLEDDGDDDAYIMNQPHQLRRGFIKNPKRRTLKRNGSSCPILHSNGGDDFDDYLMGPPHRPIESPLHRHNHRRSRNDNNANQKKVM